MPRIADQLGEDVRERRQNPAAAVGPTGAALESAPHGPAAAADLAGSGESGTPACRGTASHAEKSLSVKAARVNIPIPRTLRSGLVHQEHSEGKDRHRSPAETRAASS